MSDRERITRSLHDDLCQCNQMQRGGHLSDCAAWTAVCAAYDAGRSFENDACADLAMTWCKDQTRGDDQCFCSECDKMQSAIRDRLRGGAGNVSPRSQHPSTPDATPDDK